MQTRISSPGRALLLILPLVVSVPLRGQTPHEPFTPGETLTYDVTWSVFHAGEVTGTLRSGGGNAPDTYEVTTTARSEGVVSLLIDVNDELHSFFSPQTLCSQRIAKKIKEGRRHKDTLIVFDYIRRLALLDERDLSQAGAPAKHAENEIPSCVEDVVTGFYYLRRQHFEVGHAIELPVNDGAQTQRVVVEVQAREKVQTPLGTFDAFRVEPKVFNSLFKRKGRMLIWFSADDQQLPLRIKAIIAVGSITGTLRSVSHPPPNAPPAKP